MGGALTILLQCVFLRWTRRVLLRPPGSSGHRIQENQNSADLPFCDQDGWITPAKANDFEAALKQTQSQFEIYRYNAQHAFMNEARPQVYDAPSAKLAWERTLKFLKNVWCKRLASMTQQAAPLQEQRFLA